MFMSHYNSTMGLLLFPIKCSEGDPCGNKIYFPVFKRVKKSTLHHILFSCRSIHIFVPEEFAGI